MSRRKVFATLCIVVGILFFAILIVYEYRGNIGIRDKVKEGIADTNRILAKIDAFGKGMNKMLSRWQTLLETLRIRKRLIILKKSRSFQRQSLRSSLGSGRRRCMKQDNVAKMKAPTVPKNGKVR